MCARARAAHDDRVGFRLSRPWRRTVLALHLVTSVGWMGLDVGLAILVVTGLTTSDGPTAAAVYTAARVVVPVAVPILAAGMLLTGVLLGLGTAWGLLTWTWVFVKLCIGIVLTALVAFLLVPTALGVPAGLAGDADVVRHSVGSATHDLLMPPFVSFAALAVSLVLSLWKPGDRLPWAAQPRGSRRGDAPTRSESSLSRRSR